MARQERNRRLLCLLLICISLSYCAAVSKYSKEANVPEETENWKTIDKPFRLAKVNLIWAKAQKRLSDSKLKKLYSELKVQDKEELQLKRLKADNLDKDGLKEAELRNKFGGIIERFGLADHFENDQLVDKDELQLNHRNLFKDKKLQRLWTKAESSGFTDIELKALREEFIHHQDKVDQFYSLLESHNSKNLRENNAFLNDNLEDLQNLEEKEANEVDPVADVREKNKDLKSGYDRLERMALSGPKSKDFEEPKVQALWKAAQKGDFTGEELESLRTELRHYEQRLQKLRYLQGQQSLKTGTLSDNKSQTELAMELEQRIKLQERKVQKLHVDLETRITQKHLEL